ncbi:hypothetical protein GGR52DRAFT_32117 [Hypoxylon sp. FL1284]|nr:hypothetical protein GGR52DRAFT_32117 [Hypoxylon sp. FL1284]
MHAESQKQGSSAAGSGREGRLSQPLGPAGAYASDDDDFTATTATAASSGKPRQAVTEAERATNSGPPSSSHGVPAEKSTSATAANSAAVAAAAADATNAESYEEQHVHSVYESIASHFSATRYKPWPVVASFLASRSPGSVGLDVGCGNGKYLDVNPHVFVLATDRSTHLTRLARDLKAARAQGSSGSNSNADVTGVADGLALPFGTRRRVDFAICIAVVHHLSTRERRVAAVRALLDCVAPRAGRVLVYVWALEQAGSRRGWDEGTADQDQLVPWVMKQNKTAKKKSKDEVDTKEGGVEDEEKPTGDTTYQRYYHLYRKGELEEDVVTAGGDVQDSGYDRDNWWVIASPREEGPDVSSKPDVASQ